MNEALQTLEIKVENNGTTPQGKIFAREWNVLVEAVKALDLKGFDEAKLLQFLRDNDFITSEDIPDVDFSNVVTLSGQQKISGAKDFVGGIKVNGMPITYNAEKKYWEFTGDLIVSGAITMFGSSAGFVPSTIMDSVQVDGVTIVKNAAGQLQVIGGGGGTGGGISAAEVNILIENALKPYIKIETADDKYALISTVSGINSRLSAVETFFATEDSDTLINKWSEIVAFLNATEGDTLDNILATKANQSALDAAVASLTTEIGKKWTRNDAKISNWDSAYGWGDHANAGYAAKTYVDAELAKYVKLATAQSIEAQHNFVNGLQIGGLPITKSASANNTIYLDANLVVSGAITMFGSGSTTFPTIWANIPFNSEHMSWDGSQWNIIGGGGSGGLDTNAVNVLISEYLTKNSYATVSDISSALVGYATESFVTSRGYITSSALNGLASQSWVSDNYLSKSGGLMQDGGGIRWANNINAWDNVPDGFVGVSNLSPDPSMGYYAGLSYKGYYGLQIRAYGGGDSGLFEIRNNDSDTWQTWRTLLHSGNYSDYALPITGGTVNGDVTLSRLYTTEGVVLTNTGNSYSGLIPNNRITSSGNDEDFWLYNTHAISYEASSHTFWGDTTINGNLLTKGVITMFSQLSMKNVIDYDGLSLEQLSMIKPARFTWNDGRDNRIHVGGIADYIQPIIPEVIYQTLDDKLTMDYGSAAFYIGTSLIKPVIELWEVKDKQQEEIKALKKRVERLENENRQLRAS